MRTSRIHWRSSRGDADQVVATSCPQCHTGRVLPVLYGLPGPDQWAAVDNGDAILGGCLVGPVLVEDPVECDRCTWSGLIINNTAHGTDAFVGIIELAALTDTYQEEEHVVTVEELNRMTIEITLGWSWQDPRTEIPDTPEHHAKWKRLETQIADIKQRGRIVDIPNEWPALGDD